jgi:hypothetical protein
MLEKTPTAPALVNAIKTILRDHYSEEIFRAYTLSTKPLRILGEQLSHAKDLGREVAKMETDLALAECLGKAKRPQRKRGRRSQTAFRDLVIILAVTEAAQGGRFPFTPNHMNRHSEGPSACSIVKAALAQVGLCLSERTIEDIWGKWCSDQRRSSDQRPVLTDELRERTRARP